MANNESSDSSSGYRTGFRGGYSGRGRGGGGRKIFNARIDKLEKRSANERLLRSPKDSLFSEDSSSNVEDSNNNVDKAATEPPKRGTTPIPLLLESCIPPPESSLTMRLKKARTGNTAMFKGGAEGQVCHCFRPIKKIVCRICGKMTIGRVRRLCQVHPNHIWLLDVSACPRCEVNPMYLLEHDLRDDEPVPANKLIDKISE